MTGWIETHRNVVTAWDCDHQGHMNTVKYYEKFDVAGWHMIQRSGATRARLDADGAGCVDVRMELDFVGELKVNDPLLIESGIEKVGKTSFTFRHRMTNVNTGELVARGRCTTVYFDLNKREKTPLPDDIRAGFEAIMIGDED
tara:strand:- start:2961 stop:3389 length:429 start_codon:yes stop_codon:yes gene_type:complete